MIYGDVQHPEWRPILRWYFSPYLTTLLTAPLFLILGSVLAFEVARMIYQTLFYYLRMNVLLSGLVSMPLSLSIFASYMGIVGLPMIWAKKDWNGFMRGLVIVLSVVGVVVFDSIALFVQAYLFELAGY